MPAYTVKPGDSAAGLYDRAYGDYEAWVRNVGRLRPGQVIYLPDVPRVGIAPRAPGTTAPAPAGSVHVPTPTVVDPPRPGTTGTRFDTELGPQSLGNGNNLTPEGLGPTSLGRRTTTTTPTDDRAESIASYRESLASSRERRYGLRPIVGEPLSGAVVGRTAGLTRQAESERRTNLATGAALPLTPNQELARSQRLSRYGPDRPFLATTGEPLPLTAAQREASAQRLARYGRSSPAPGVRRTPPGIGDSDLHRQQHAGDLLGLYLNNWSRGDPNTPDLPLMINDLVAAQMPLANTKYYGDYKRYLADLGYEWDPNALPERGEGAWVKKEVVDPLGLGGGGFGLGPIGRPRGGGRGSSGDGISGGFGSELGLTRWVM